MKPVKMRYARCMSAIDNCCTFKILDIFFNHIRRSIKKNYIVFRSTASVSGIHIYESKKRQAIISGEVFFCLNIDKNGISRYV